jgi:hypothetical protein
MTSNPPTVNIVTTIQVPDSLPPAISKPRQLVAAVLAQSLAEAGTQGRAALAWAWALTGRRPSPVTLSVATGSPPSRGEIMTEACASPEGSTAPPGVPTDFCDQLREARHILRWLIGETDEIPVDDDNRGRFIGARDDYARSDEQIRAVRDRATHGPEAFDLPEPITPADTPSPWQWPATWMNAAWLRGVRDLLDWVLGDRQTSPLGQQVPKLPTASDLDHEDLAAEDVVSQDRPGGTVVDPQAYPPPQYGEAIQATTRWLRGEAVVSPVEQAAYYGNIHSLADQGNCGVAGEPGALVVPAGAGLLAAAPVRPVLGVAGRGGLGGEQAGDLRDGQRDHPGVGGEPAGRAGAAAAPGYRCGRAARQRSRRRSLMPP